MGGGVLGDTISASSFEKYIGNAIILSDYTANIPGDACAGNKGEVHLQNRGCDLPGPQQPLLMHHHQLLQQQLLLPPTPPPSLLLLLLLLIIILESRQ